MKRGLMDWCWDFAELRSSAGKLLRKTQNDAVGGYLRLADR